VGHDIDPSRNKLAKKMGASVRKRWLADRALTEWDQELGELEISGTMYSLGSMSGLGLSPQKPKDA
jgi:hypothetical protein